MVKNTKTLILLVLSVALVTGTMLMGGCVGEETETPSPATTQTSTDITPQEAFLLTQNNPDAVILDVGTPANFAEEHIEGAINLYYHSDTFEDELNQLDKDKTYIAYCRCQGRGIAGSAVDKMTELNFKEAYSIFGGLDNWKAEGLPTTDDTVEAVYVDTITPEKAFALMQEKAEYVIIDARTPEEFANEHLPEAINIDYQSENFRDELNQLDKSNTTFAYYKPYSQIPHCCGDEDNLQASLDIFQTLKELNFKEAYFINGGIISWLVKGLPTVKP